MHNPWTHMRMKFAWISLNESRARHIKQLNNISFSFTFSAHTHMLCTYNAFVYAKMNKKRNAIEFIVDIAVVVDVLPFGMTTSQMKMV